MSRGKIITVFGSSRPREGDSEYEQARELGWALASKGFRVCSGGYGGVMEGVSRGAKDAGGATLAVTAEFFRGAQCNAWVDKEIRVKSWQQRLFRLIRLGAGFVAVKGGTGTLVELAVVWEMINKRVIRPKPFVALGDFWQPVIERVREVEAGWRGPLDTKSAVWQEASGRLIYVSRSPADAADFLERALKGRRIQAAK